MVTALYELYDEYWWNKSNYRSFYDNSILRVFFINIDAVDTKMWTIVSHLQSLHIKTEDESLTPD